MKQKCFFGGLQSVSETNSVDGKKTVE